MPDPTPAPAPAPAPSPAPAPAPAPSPEPAWHGLTEAADIAYINNKGWKAPTDVIKSYRGVESLVGRDPSTLIPVPRADDPAGFRAAMTKLGLPESPDKYEFAAPPAGIKPDDKYIAWARSTFHELGLPASVVKALSEKHNAHVAAVLAQQETDYNLAVATDKKALLTEWGAGHERMMNAAQSAAKNLGFTAPMIDAMERTVGYAGTYKFFADLGKKLGEPGFVAGTEAAKFAAGVTPEEAKAEWAKMKTDPTVMAALTDKSHPAHKEQSEKKSKLFAIMYPEQKAA